MVLTVSSVISPVTGFARRAVLLMPLRKFTRVILSGGGRPVHYGDSNYGDSPNYGITVITVTVH
jgi:hypothetical protein